MVLALLLAQRSALTIVRGIVAATSAIAAVVVARIFGEMMIPGAWGDCICCGGRPPSGPRDIQPPLILQLSPAARTSIAIGVLIVMLLVTLALLIVELRAADRRLRSLVMTTASLAIFFCAGWLIVRAPGFIWWTDGWRYVAIMCGIASIVCVASSVAIVRKSIPAFSAAVLFVALSYVVTYHAVGFFGMMDR